MSKVHDNWEKLVAAVVDREKLRHIAHCDSLSSSSFSTDRSSGRISFSSSLRDGLEASRYPQREADILSSPHIHAFTFTELKKATRNFGPNSFLGEGRFGYIYEGWIDEHTLKATRPGSGLVIAIRKLMLENIEGHEDCLKKFDHVWRLHHPNLVKLTGYCSEEGGLLVYEFVRNGSLQDHLFRKGIKPLTWAVRMKVAIGAARGLSFLHEAEEQVIYRHFKSSNILLDEEFNAKLSDFGFPGHAPKYAASTLDWNIYGCAAPEYVATGRLTAKSDVYGFGVVLLELLSSRRAVDKTKVGIEQNLVDWSKPYMGDKRKLFRIMDIKLEGQYPRKAAFTAATLALHCLDNEPKMRPRMAEVVATLEGLRQEPRKSSSRGANGGKTMASPLRL